MMELGSKCSGGLSFCLPAIALTCPESVEGVKQGGDGGTKSRNHMPLNDVRDPSASLVLRSEGSLPALRSRYAGRSRVADFAE
jgi:hypothetical protein